LREMLTHKRFEDIAELAAGRKRTFGVLVSLTYDGDRLVAWRAAEAQGWAAERIADSKPEFVRSHLRRLHWLLSEESGGICRHAPQAMAEIVARAGDAFTDYAAITASLLTDMAEEDLAGGLRTAVLWALGRLAPVAPAHVEPLIPAVAASFDDPDLEVRGLAVWCALQAGRRALAETRPGLAEDTSTFEIYRDGEFHTTSTRDLLARG
jgi:hypothetical protein